MHNMDILEDSTQIDGGLEIDRFKKRILDIWSRMLEETYAKYPDEISKEEYMESNALKFAGDPEEEDELDNLLAMLEELLDPQEELDDVKSEGKAPAYKGEELKANNEKGNVEVTTYEVKHASTDTPKDVNSSRKGGTYAGVEGGKLSPRKDAKVIRSFSPMAEQIRDELKSLKERQNIGRRRELFRL